MPYYAVRPISDDEDHRNRYTRIEKALTPDAAYRLAFGRGTNGRGCEWKLLSQTVAPLRSDRRRRQLLSEPEGWTRY